MLPLHQTRHHHADGQGEGHGAGGEDHGPDEDLHEGTLDTRVCHDADEVLPAHAHHEARGHPLADEVAIRVDVLVEAGVRVRQHQLAALVVTQQVAVLDHDPRLLQHNAVRQLGVERFLGGELAQAAQGQVDIAIRQHQIQGAQVGAVIDDGTDGCRPAERFPVQGLQLNNLRLVMDPALTDGQFTRLVVQQGKGLTDKGLVVLLQQQLELIVLTTQEGEIEFTAGHLIDFFQMEIPCLLEGEQVGSRVVGEGDADRVGKREDDKNNHACHTGEDIAVGIGLLVHEDIETDGNDHQIEQGKHPLAAGIHHHGRITIKHCDQCRHGPLQPDVLVFLRTGIGFDRRYYFHAN